MKKLLSLFVLLALCCVSISSAAAEARTFTEGEVLYLNAGYVTWWQNGNAVQIATFDGETRVVGTPANDPTKVAFEVPAGSYSEVVFSRHESADSPAWNSTGAIALGGTTENMVAEFAENSSIAAWGNYSGGGMVIPDCPDALYVIGEVTTIGWTPGKQKALTKNGNLFTGRFTFTSSSDICYFALTSSASANWDDVNANRYGSQGALTDESPVILTIGDGATCTIAPGEYDITVDWTSFTVKATRVGDVVKPECPDALYILGEVSGIGWNPGAKVALTKNGNVFTGRYTFTSSEEICYFTLTSSASAEWDDVNANRYGSQGTLTDENPVSVTIGADVTATIAPGEYDITVDWDAFTIKATRVGDVVKPECPDALYMIGNIANVGWTAGSGIEMTKNGNVFTGTATFAADGENTLCWFCFSATNNHEDATTRFGSAADIVAGENVAVTGPGDLTATIAPGTYTITVDWDAFTITATQSATGIKAVTAKDVISKQLVNGQIVIIRDGVRYSVQGVRL